MAIKRISGEYLKHVSYILTFSLIMILHQHKYIDFKDLDDILNKMVRDTSSYNINIYYIFDRIFSKIGLKIKSLIFISTDKKLYLKTK